MPRSWCIFLFALLGCSGEKALTVYNSVPAASITNPIEDQRFAHGEEIRLTGIVNDSKTPYDALVVSWGTDQDGVLTDAAPVDSDGLTLFPTATLTSGVTHTVSLRVVDEGGKSATDSIVIHIDDEFIEEEEEEEEEEIVNEPSITILSPHPSGSDSPWEEGVPFPFEAGVTDGQDSPELISVEISTTDPDGEVLDILCNPTPYVLDEGDTEGFVFCEVDLEPGAHDFLFKATDTEGYVGTATSQIRVQSLDSIDNDGDGFTEIDGDCDDTDEDVHPGATEVINGVDEDCDGLIDEGTSAYDDDGDGFSEDDGDCDDTDAAIHPSATEICDSIDNDCDGVIDGEDTVDGIRYYQDLDGDGFGNWAVSLTACDPPTGYVTDDTDCNDTDAAALPGGTEACDGIDNDCNGSIDEEGAEGCVIWYQDLDDDGYGSTVSTCACASADPFTSHLSSDCYDLSATVNPTHTEWHTSDRGDGSFDYNCNWIEEKQVTIVAGDCGFFDEGVGCSAIEGWSGSAGSCGASSTWNYDCHYEFDWFDSGCYWRTRSETQACR